MTSLSSKFYQLPTSFRLVRKSNSRLEMALRHVVGVHPEKVGVVIRVLEPHDIHFPAERNLRDVIYLYRTDTSRLDFLRVQCVHHPFHIATVVHVLVHVKVAILCRFLGDDLRFQLRIQNIHHFRERVLALNQRNRVWRICRVFGLAGFHVHQEPRRRCLRDGVPLRIENGIVFETNFVLNNDVFTRSVSETA